MEQIKRRILQGKSLGARGNPLALPVMSSSRAIALSRLVGGGYRACGADRISCRTTSGCDPLRPLAIRAAIPRSRP